MERLTIGARVTREHRDGWVFQILSWLAACIQSGGSMATSLPQQQLASKGFDGLLIPLAQNGNSFEYVTVCEDKATVNPRRTITDQVWGELEELERGRRDAELTDALVAILERYQIPDVERLIESVQWHNNKHYRVSLTIPEAESSEPQRAKIFRGYDQKVTGDNSSRRRAETITLNDLRAWMDGFCEQVKAVIQTM